MVYTDIFSKGKIILMGEYAVLHGADALCLPLSTGQKLKISELDDQIIRWQWDYDQNNLVDHLWFSIQIHRYS